MPRLHSTPPRGRATPRLVLCSVRSKPVILDASSSRQLLSQSNTHWQRVLLFSFVPSCRQSTVERGLGRQLPGNQRQQQQSAHHTPPPVGGGAACADEVMGRLQQTAER